MASSPEQRLLERLSPEQQADARSDARLEAAFRSLYAFVQVFWEVVRPGEKFSPNWHVKAVCEELEATARGETRRLVLMLPPGYGKSLLTSVFFPAWLWLHYASRELMALANDISLTVRDSRRTKVIVSSEPYQRLLAKVAKRREPPAWVVAQKRRAWTIKEDQRALANWGNTAEGFRQCLSMGASVTGKRTHFQVVDDPIDAKKAILFSPAQVAAAMAKVQHNYDKVLSSRLNPWNARIVIAQGLHQLDLPNTLATRSNYRVVRIPVYAYAKTDPMRYPGDPREEGELLMPDVYSEEDTEEQRQSLGSEQFDAQYMQRPRAAEGRRFKRGWFKRYAAAPMTMGHMCDEVWFSADCAATDTKTADLSALQMWGRKGNKRFLLDRRAGQWAYPELKRETLAMLDEWRLCGIGRLIVEQASNGIPLADDLESLGYAVDRFKPGGYGGKETRASYTEAAAESGVVYIPEDDHRTAGVWVAAWLKQHLAFPDKPCDDVDATSQVMVRMNERAATGAADRYAKKFAFLADL